MDTACPTHPDVSADRTCPRCGAFMCETCTEHGLETRCVACRPKRTAEERWERRRNAVKRNGWCLCEACGYEGPPLKKFVEPTGTALAWVFMGPFILCGIGYLLSLWTVVEGFTQLVCPVCQLDRALWPSSARSSLPDAWVQANLRQNESWFRPRQKALAAFVLSNLVLLALAALMLFGPSKSFSPGELN